MMRCDQDRPPTADKNTLYKVGWQAVGAAAAAKHDQVVMTREVKDPRHWLMMVFGPGGALSSEYITLGIDRDIDGLLLAKSLEMMAGSGRPSLPFVPQNSQRIA